MSTEIVKPNRMTSFPVVAGFIGAAATGGLWTFTGLVFASFKGLALGVIVTFAYYASTITF
jgi:hypothetical protein